MYHSAKFTCPTILALITVTNAMDMGTSSSTSSSESMAMMTPYLHFTGGDHLFFAGVAPTSNGAIAGACIALVVLAILERAVAGARGIFALKLADRRRLVQSQNAHLVDVDTETPAIDKRLGSDGISVVNTTPRSSPTFGIQPLSPKRQRVMAPFLWTHELARGALYILQAFLLYTIMLGVMTFNAGYIISIIAGSAIGEVLFGRFIAEVGH